MKNFKLNNFIPLTSIMLLALTLRILWVVKVPTVPVSDFLQYYKGAVSIVNGTGYRVYGHISAYEPVGYSLFLAAIFFFFGSFYIVAKVANILLALIGILFLFLIVKKYLKLSFAYICTFLFAILPINIAYTSVISTEIIFTTLFIISIYVILNKHDIKYSNIIIGILLGILSLIKPYMLVYSCCILLYEVIKYRALKVPIKNFVIITFCLVITICPWTIRNYFVFHKIIPISTNGGYNLYVNNNPQATGAWMNPRKIKNSIITKYSDKNDKFWNEVKVDEAGKKYAFKWIIDNPIAFIHLGEKKLKNTFFTPDSGYWATGFLANNEHFSYGAFLTALNSNVLFYTNFFILIYLIICIFELFKKKIKEIHILSIVTFCFYFVIIFVFEGQPRYLFPLWSIYTFCILYTIQTLFFYISSKFLLKTK